MQPTTTNVINRYDAYFGSNVTIEQIAKVDNEDGTWLKLSEVLAALGVKTPKPPKGVKSYSFDDDGLSITLDSRGDNYIATSGGEHWDGDYHSDSYNISVGPVTIFDMTAAQLSKLAVEAINHLRNNGHRFDYRYGATDNREGFVEVDMDGKVVVGEGIEKYHAKT